MNGYQINPLVINIAAKIQAMIVAIMEDDAKRSNRRFKKPIFTKTTLIALLKECGLIEGRRGRGDGFYPTDSGLEFIGQDVAEYHEKEAQEKEKMKEERREKQRQVREQRNQLFNTSLLHSVPTGRIERQS